MHLPSTQSCPDSSADLVLTQPRLPLLLLLLLLLPQACKAVMNLHHVGEGELIKRTALPALVLILVSTAMSCLFLFAAPGHMYVWPDHPLPAAA
jgi:hypothetical protein